MYAYRPMTVVSAVALLFVVLMGGCSAGSNSDRLLIAVNAGVEADGLKAAVEDYRKEYGVRVEIVEFPYQSLFEKIQLAFSGSSTEYDLVMMDDPWFPRLAQMGGLAELGEFYRAKGLDGPDDDFVEPCIRICRYPYATGELFALPYVGNTQLFFFRKDLLEKHDLAPPKTWQEVLDHGRAIGAAEGMHGYVMRAAQGNPIVADFMPLLWAHGGRMFDDEGQVVVNSPESLAALEFMLKLAEIVPPGYVNFNADEVGAHLAQGTAVMGINWPAWIPTFEDAQKSKVPGQIGYSTMPSATSPGASSIGNWLLGIPDGSSKKEAAFDFLFWVTQRDQMRLSALRGNPPTRTSLFEDPELVERFPAYPVQYQALLGSRPRPRTPLWNEIENTFGSYLSQANAGIYSPREALDRAHEEISGIVQRWQAQANP